MCIGLPSIKKKGTRLMNETLSIEQLAYISAVIAVGSAVVAPFFKLSRRIDQFEKSLIEQGHQLATIAAHYREQEERHEQQAKHMEMWRKDVEAKQANLQTAVAIHGETIRRLNDGRH